MRCGQCSYPLQPSGPCTVCGSENRVPAARFERVDALDEALAATLVHLQEASGIRYGDPTLHRCLELLALRGARPFADGETLLLPDSELLDLLPVEAALTMAYQAARHGQAPSLSAARFTEQGPVRGWGHIRFEVAADRIEAFTSDGRVKQLTLFADGRVEGDALPPVLPPDWSDWRDTVLGQNAAVRAMLSALEAPSEVAGLEMLVRERVQDFRQPLDALRDRLARPEAEMLLAERAALRDKAFFKALDPAPWVATLATSATTEGEAEARRLEQRALDGLDAAADRCMRDVSLRGLSAAGDGLRQAVAQMQAEMTRLQDLATRGATRAQTALEAALQSLKGKAGSLMWGFQKHPELSEVAEHAQVLVDRLRERNALSQVRRALETVAARVLERQVEALRSLQAKVELLQKMQAGTARLVRELSAWDPTLVERYEAALPRTSGEVWAWIRELTPEKPRSHDRVLDKGADGMRKALVEAMARETVCV
ncbi:MAG: hypothetical protein FJX76_10475 [Armatimonadetes bacterium]|nr:hypothetical protein [Armatimonadota bacterium]